MAAPETAGAGLRPLDVTTGTAIGVGPLRCGRTVVVSLLGAPASAIGPRAERSTDDHRTRIGSARCTPTLTS